MHHRLQQGRQQVLAVPQRGAQLQPARMLTRQPHRMRRQRHAAAAAQRTRHRPFGLHRQHGGAVGQAGQALQECHRVGAHFEPQRALPRAGQHVRRLEHRANPRPQAKALQPGRRQHDRIKLAFVELAQPSVQVAAQRLHLQVRPQRTELHHPPQAGGADAGALRQFGQRRKLVGHERVARIFALQHGRQLEAFGQVHRHVLQRMHRQVGVASFQRGFEFLDKQPLAAHLGQRAVQNLVAARGHAQQLHLQPETGLQQLANMLCLPQREAAFAGGDDEGFGHASMLSGAPLA